MKTEWKKVFRGRSKINCFFVLKDFLNEEATYELYKITEIKNNLNRDILINKKGNNKMIKHIIFQSLRL